MVNGNSRILLKFTDPRKIRCMLMEDTTEKLGLSRPPTNRAVKKARPSKPRKPVKSRVTCATTCTSSTIKATNKSPECPNSIFYQNVQENHSLSPDDLEIFIADILRPRYLPKLTGVFIFVLTYSVFVVTMTSTLLLGDNQGPEWLLLCGTSFMFQFLVVEPLKCLLMALYETWYTAEVMLA